MRALALVGLVAMGASATYTQWSMTTDARDDFRVLRTDDGVYFSLELMSAKLTAKEAASLGRALLEAAGESRFQSVGVDPRYGPLFYEPESACSLLNRYIAIRQKELADPEISEFYRKVHENEITALRTKIQEKAIDGWCR